MSPERRQAALARTSDATAARRRVRLPRAGQGNRPDRSPAADAAKRWRAAPRPAPRVTPLGWRRAAGELRDRGLRTRANGGYLGAAARSGEAFEGVGPALLELLEGLLVGRVYILPGGLAGLPDPGGASPVVLRSALAEFEADSQLTAPCYEACAKAWRPLLTAIGTWTVIVRPSSLSFTPIMPQSAPAHAAGAPPTGSRFPRPAPGSRTRPFVVASTSSARATGHGL
jgi:hypothetical protein